MQTHGSLFSEHASASGSRYRPQTNNRQICFSLSFWREKKFVLKALHEKQNFKRGYYKLKFHATISNMYYNSQNITNAKHMRSNMTQEELKIWNLLRAKRFYGYKFKRQVLVGEYIVDFICPEKNLVIEIDGGQHNEDCNKNYDLKRTCYLENNGYTVLRFWNNDVNNNIEGVCEVIKNYLENS